MSDERQKERQKVEFKYTCYNGDEINFVLDKETIHVQDLIKGFFNWAEIVYGADVEKAYQEDAESTVKVDFPNSFFADEWRKKVEKAYREQAEREGQTNSNLKDAWDKELNAYYSKDLNLAKALRKIPGED
jgi:hypothetical protein